MDSPNIAHVPLNREGAIELGQSPCSVCDVGWANFSEGKDGESTSETCHDTCELLKRYSKRQAKGEPFFGTHIREVIETFKEVFKKKQCR